MTAMTSLRLLAMLDVLPSTPARAKRRAPRRDGPLTHFVSPRGEKYRLAKHCVGIPQIRMLQTQPEMRTESPPWEQLEANIPSCPATDTEHRNQPPQAMKL